MSIMPELRKKIAKTRTIVVNMIQNTVKNQLFSKYTNGDKWCYNLGGSKGLSNVIFEEGGLNMNSVLDVAKYILDRHGPMTTMKLEKLVYYAQAWSLAWDEKPLFDDDFEAWANGPVCPKLFNAHKGLYEVSCSLFSKMKPACFTDDEIDTIDTVLDYYGDKEPQWLSNLTHSEPPWRYARNGLPDGLPCNNIITKDSMQQYYGGLASGAQE